MAVVKGLSVSKEPVRCPGNPLMIGECPHWGPWIGMDGRLVRGICIRDLAKDPCPHGYKWTARQLSKHWRTGEARLA